MNDCKTCAELYKKLENGDSSDYNRLRLHRLAKHMDEVIAVHGQCCGSNRENLTVERDELSKKLGM